jgi:hypothetical protein
VGGTADPAWSRLLAHLCKNSAEAVAQLTSLFSPSKLEHTIHAVPSFIVTALIKGLAGDRCSPALQRCMLRALAYTVARLAVAGDAPPLMLTPSKASPAVHPSTAAF